jgi:hypothetical protein
MRNITKLSVFDFDGTLVDTPMPEDGKKVYKEKTGQDWPFAGWWGQPLSLSMDVFEMPTIASTIKAYNNEKRDASTAVVMLTGRMVKLGDKVKDILDKKGLKFDEYHYNKGGSTDVAKIKTLDELLIKYPNVQKIEMWDDRDEHIPIFQAWGDKLVSSGRLSDFKINHVIQQRH